MKKILVSILILFNLVLSSCNKETISNDFIIENYFQGDINMSAKNLKQIPDFNKIASGSYINEVVSINLLSNQIETLDGSKFKIFPNLQKINISFNNISKFKNLDNLNVNYIDLSKNKISNLDGIGDLSNIKNLNLNFNEISDVNKLTNLKSLVALHLAHNQIEEINQLNELNKLKELHIEFNKINNIDDLLGMGLFILTTAKNNLPEDLVNELNAMSLKNMKKTQN